MSDEKTMPADQRTIKDGAPVRNLSGETPTIGATVRLAQRRDALGRFKPRANRLVGPLGPPGGVGPGGIDAVTGRWISGVRNSAQLHDWDRVHAVTTRPYFEVPDYSWGVDPARKSHDAAAEAHAYVNHRLSCPICTVLGG